MIGKNAITKEVKSVIVVVGDNPSWFNGHHQGDIPLIYTQKSRPKPNDLAILKDKQVQVVYKNGTDELFAKWCVEIANSKPNFLIATDSTGEVFCL